MIAEKPAASYSYTGGVKETTGSNPRHRDITDPCRGICQIFLASIKSSRKVSTCDRLVSETLGSQPFNPMIGENRFTDEPVEFEKEPVEVEDCRRITDWFGRIYGRIYPNLIKEHRNSMQGWPGRFLGTLIGRDPSVWKSTRLHVDNILQCSFIKWGIFFYRFL